MWKRTLSEPVMYVERKSIETKLPPKNEKAEESKMRFKGNCKTCSKKVHKDADC